MTDPYGRTSLRPDRCTTHHHACDCREAVHREVANALEEAIYWMGEIMWSRLDYTKNEQNEALSSYKDVLERYKMMYG